MKKIVAIAVLLFTVTGIFAQRNSTISVDRYYTIKQGNVLFHATRLMYGYNDGITYPQSETDNIYFYNSGDTPLECSFDDLPTFLFVKIEPNPVPPKSEAKIAVRYDSKTKNTFGPTFDYFYMTTNDTKRPRKRLIVSPKITEDFSDLTEAQIAIAPVISFDETKFDFGKIEMGEKINHTFKFTNKGKNDLIIRATKASCGCTSPTPKTKIIKSGEQGEIEVLFNSFGKHGEQNHRITIITNDYRNPETILYITGFVKVEKSDK
ncbi:MAG: DUF1573 domain-containing protein [Bacteroidota bacterium]|nr:DUF1573 domain-containing protein [Bacteroidota bacterium]